MKLCKFIVVTYAAADGIIGLICEKKQNICFTNTQLVCFYILNEAVYVCNTDEKCYLSWSSCL